jgi:hypothetical protein
MYYNEWYQYVKMPNINGVFGMAYFADYQDMNSFWYNMIVQQYNTTMGVSLIPSNKSYEFINDAPNVENTHNSLMIGDYNRSLYIEANTNTSLTVNSAYPNLWIFTCNVYAGLINTTNATNITEYYVEVSNEDYMEVMV